MELIIDKVMALKTADIFSDLPEHVLAEIAEIIEIEAFNEGEKIISKGEIGNTMYLIRTGKVKVHNQDKVFATLGENEIVGELSLLAPVPRTATVTATEDLVLFKIEREYFMDLLYEEPELMHGIMRVLVNRIIDLNDKLRSHQSVS
jgi:CRP/FNR family transcriptional regulator, cyclic AMP receptor protein